MKFLDWIKIKEQIAAASPSAGTISTSVSTNASSSNGLRTTDVKSVPKGLGSCRSCSQDWNNWYISKKRRKKKL